jgi:hypothetical protein
MTKEEFLYAARCNFHKSGLAKAQKYIEKNPKDDYDDKDWVAVFYSDPEPIKTGKDRPLMSKIGEPGNYGYTSRQWS